MTGHLKITSVSGLVTVQDRGRRGLASMGVGVSGAADRGSHDRANRLVGNHASAATLEMTFGTLQFFATTPTWIALAGAPAEVLVCGRPHPIDTRIMLRAGEDVSIGPAPSGLRTYVAVRGGIGVTPVLGSRSTDTLARLGPDHVRANDVLDIATDQGEFPMVDFIVERRTHAGSVLRLDLVLGPRDNWFTPSAVAVLGDATWTVTPASNRVGVRLDGPPLERLVLGELPSEGVPVGSVQVPPAGPIVFLDDHPVTGGYPVIGVIDRASLDRLAQARPGQQVCFRAVSVAAPRQPTPRTTGP